MAWLFEVEGSYFRAAPHCHSPQWRASDLWAVTGFEPASFPARPEMLCQLSYTPMSDRKAARP